MRGTILTGEVLVDVHCSSQGALHSSDEHPFLPSSTIHPGTLVALAWLPAGSTLAAHGKASNRTNTRAVISRS